MIELIANILLLVGAKLLVFMLPAVGILAYLTREQFEKRAALFILRVHIWAYY